MTMQLTRVTTDPADKDTRWKMTHPQAVHAIVAAATEGSERPLWRLEGDRIYILSDQIDTDRLTARLAHPAIATRDYTGLLDAITPGSRWGFRLTAAPSVRRLDGTIHAITDLGERLAWLRRKLATAGATTDTAAITGSHATRFRHGDARHITLGTVDYTGTLTVTDPDALRHAMTHGIGRAKAYGHGLLMLAPLHTAGEKA